MTYQYGDKVNEWLTPDDANQFAIKCRDCSSKKVVFHITVPALPQGLLPGIPVGAYCYKCLVARCRAAHRIPTPMSVDLYDAVTRELTGPGKILLTMPG